MKYFTIGVLIAIIIFLIFLALQEKPNYDAIEFTESEELNINQENTDDNITIPQNNTAAPVQTTQPDQVNNNNNNNIQLENIETSLVIKNIIQNGSVWRAEVDYTTRVSMPELLQFQIERGLCNIPNMSQTEMIAYANTLTEPNLEIDNNLFIGRCQPDFASDISMFYTDHNINQNPQIRTFDFAPDFQTLNSCENNLQTPSDYITLLNSSPDYVYDIYNTQGLKIPKAIIKDSKIVSFDFIAGCAS